MQLRWWGPRTAALTSPGRAGPSASVSAAHHVKERDAVAIGIRLKDLVPDRDPDSLEGLLDRTGEVAVNLEHGIDGLLGGRSLRQRADLHLHDPRARLIGIADRIDQPCRREVASPKAPEADELGDVVAAVRYLVAVHVLEDPSPTAERLAAPRPDVPRARDGEALPALGVGGHVLASRDRGPVGDLEEVPTDDLPPSLVVAESAGGEKHRPEEQAQQHQRDS